MLGVYFFSARQPCLPIYRVFAWARAGYVYARKRVDRDCVLGRESDYCRCKLKESAIDSCAQCAFPSSGPANPEHRRIVLRLHGNSLLRRRLRLNPVVVFIPVPSHILDGILISSKRPCGIIELSVKIQVAELDSLTIKRGLHYFDLFFECFHGIKGF